MQICILYKQVDFFATYTADVLTSSVKTILDIVWTIGFFVSGDFLLHRKAWLGRDLHSSSWEQACHNIIYYYILLYNYLFEVYNATINYFFNYTILLYITLQLYNTTIVTLQQYNTTICYFTTMSYFTVWIVLYITRGFLCIVWDCCYTPAGIYSIVVCYLCVSSAAHCMFVRCTRVYAS
jgi:hypothetical protein